MGEALNTPTVSVVVPFYNLEGCATYCVKSLAGQSYVDCEFVLVDDGSSDGTPALLDELTSGDDRFRVFHEKNRGLSGARNYGVSVATGELITFVDGDDFVHSDYVKELVDAYMRSGCGMVIAHPKMVRFMDEKNDASFDEVGQGFEVITPQLAIEYACYEDRAFPSAWSCLARREQYCQVPFPQGHVYEEIYTFCDYVGRYESICLLKSRLYGYVMRENSIVNRKHARIGQARDFTTSIKKFSDDASRLAPEKREAIAFFEAHHLCQLHDLCMVVEDVPEEAYKIDAVARARLRELLPVTKADSRVSRAQQTRFELLAKSAKLYQIVFGLYKLAKKGF